MTINKNLAYAIGIVIVGSAYFLTAAVLGYNLIPPVTDANGNQTRGFGAFLGLLVAVAIVGATICLNKALNEREEAAKARQARLAMEASRGY
jgi:hypothetical protein